MNGTHKMHENEWLIDEALVRRLLQSQCPKWAGLPLSRIPSSGTENALFRLGEQYVVRLPRTDWAGQSLDKEYKWVPRLAALLRMPISVPLFKGEPTSEYPSKWQVTSWCDGANPNFEQDGEYTALAKDLAQFLNKFHALPIADGPLSRRGIALREVNGDVLVAIDQLHDEVDTYKLKQLWLQLIAVPNWNQPAAWLHGDLLPGNILVTQQRLSALIDFSDVGMGDPAVDCVIAWALMNESSRVIFKSHLNLDENTWLRGKGWALSIAVIMLPYYKESNLVMAALARRMIDQILL